MKRAVAHAALEELKGFLDQKFTEERPFVFGLGTGSTVAEFWPILHEYLQKINQKNVVIVPTSLQSKQLVLSGPCKYPLVELQQYPIVDCLVDGFDEVELDKGGMIKGGGGAHTLEKLVAQCSKHTIYIGTSEKISEKLGDRKVAIPVEVVPPAAQHVTSQLSGIGGTCKIRESAKGKAGPVVTDLGNLIVDWHLPSGHPLWDNVDNLSKQIQVFTGVVACGIFISQIELAIMAREDGSLIYKRYVKC